MSIVDDLKLLVESQSPTEDLAACRATVSLANQICERVLGSSAEIIEENGRPVFWWGAKQPSVVILAHLDTVWPHDSFTPLWSIDGDVIRGPGVFDMKAGFLQAMYALQGIEIAAARVALIATTDEEVGSQTSRELIKRVSQPGTAVLVVESAIDGKVKTGRKGTAMYQITVHGRAAHAGLEPEKGINASVEIAHIVLALTALENIELGTTVVPTTMHSGSTTNTVPALARVDVDARSFTLTELERIDAAIKSLAPKNIQSKIEVTGGINRPPLESAATAKLYAIFEEVAIHIGQGPIGSAVVGGASDGNFAAAAGADVLDGLGAIGAGAHAENEHVLLSSIEPRITLLREFIKELISE
jgi:glutamate carboxypeptidase